MSRRKVSAPRQDAAIEAGLSALYRKGEIHAYSYEQGTWSTWGTAHDWDHTERNGHYRCSCCAPEMSLQHGPRDWDRSDLLLWLGLSDKPAPRGLSKAQLITRLRQTMADTPLFDLEQAITELLEAA